MKELLLVCAGSLLGGGMRYLISVLFRRLGMRVVPLATITVNVLGCFLIGLLSGMSFNGICSPSVKLFLVTGFCGGFTTFSTFMNENVMLAGNNGLLQALLYTFLSLFLGVVAVVAGYALAK